MELLREIEEKYVETNGIKLHTMIAGSGEPIIMLHGFPDFWYGWRDIIMGLKDEYKCIAPDMRGYNLSDKPKGTENYQLDICADDIKGLSEALNIGKFYLAVTEFDVERYIEAWSQPGSVDGGLAYYRAINEDREKYMEGWTGIINVPTLVIHGKKDPAILPQTLKNLENYVKDLKIVYVENASHFVMVDAPEIVIANIKEFIG